MPGEVASYAAIVLLALITLVTRVAGAELLRKVAMTGRLKAFLDTLALAVLVALVASFLAQHGSREAAAVAVACALMMLTRSPILAMVGGMATAALWALAGG